jgi:class 3 adenylate cyclase
MLEAGFSVEEFDLIQRSQSRSDHLARLEEVAMNAVVGRFDDGTGRFAIVGEPDPEMARDLLHGDRYQAAKADIMAPLGEFLAAVERRTTADVEAHRSELRSALGALIGLVAALLAGSVLFFGVLARRLVGPVQTMAATARKVGEGELSARSGVRGSNEVGRLGEVLDETLERLQGNIVELEAAQNEALAQSARLAAAHQRSDELLLNVLPAPIADRLKHGEETIAESFPEVTVLFSDIVGFTELAERIGAKQIVGVLNEVFGIFDDVAAACGIEKIKTIGDCYMVVGGVPDRSPTHAQQVAEFALKIEERMSAYRSVSGLDIQMRSGIHTGTVVAGVIGTNKFAYDLWGHVVNLASRLESSGLPGRIHVSESLRVRLQDDYEFEPRGEIELKGLGTRRTHFLIGRRGR